MSTPEILEIEKRHAYYSDPNQFIGQERAWKLNRAESAHADCATLLKYIRSRETEAPAAPVTLTEEERAFVELLRFPKDHPLYVATGTIERFTAIIDRLTAPTTAPAPPQPELPELICERCGGPNVTWFAPNEVWNRVVGSPNGIWCPGCFISHAEANGFDDRAWKVEPEAAAPPQPQTPGIVYDLGRVLDHRLNAYLCEMKPNHDDSISGFNDAWHIVSEAFRETLRSNQWLVGKDREAYIATMDAADIVDDVCERPEMFTAAIVAVARYARSLRNLPAAAPPQMTGRVTREEIANAILPCHGQTICMSNRRVAVGRVMDLLRERGLHQPHEVSAVTPATAEN